MKKILMIEDDFELAEILSEYLELNEFRVKICGEPYLGLSELNINTYDLEQKLKTQCAYYYFKRAP